MGWGGSEAGGLAVVAPGAWFSLFSSFILRNVRRWQAGSPSCEFGKKVVVLRDLMVWNAVVVQYLSSCLRTWDF